MKHAAASRAAGMRGYLSPQEISPPRHEDNDLRLSVLYHDELTRDWAHEVYAICRQVAGQDSVRATWWSIQELNQPAVLAGAVSRAMHSEMIVLAMRADSPLPLAFYYWADAWLPHRTLGPGALVALVGHSEQSYPKSDRTREYLRVLSRRGGLEFVLEHHSLPKGDDPRWVSNARFREALTAAVLRAVSCASPPRAYGRQSLQSLSV